eukprot:NODE_4_length_55019_cov_0.425091.p16 type:complete len:345 gc:universal NODE_4_length_55019_cov_0.425091:54920-53886(-)
MSNLRMTYAGRSILRIKQRRHDLIDIVLLQICYMEDPDLVKGLPLLLLPNLNYKTVDSKDIKHYKRLFPFYSTIFASLEQYYQECAIQLHPEIQLDISSTLENQSMDEFQKLKKVVKSRINGSGLIDKDYWDFLLFEIHNRISQIVLSDFINQRFERYGRVLQKRFNISGDSKDVIDLINAKILEQIEVVPFQIVDKKLQDDPWLLEQIEKMPLAGGESVINDIDPDTPSKPKHFSRVLCGIEWTSYNQANFDADNLPPTQILGYKFAIFYPKLEEIPDYCKVPDPIHRDKEIIIFKSGGPYSDIRFRIYKREWDTNYKSGFNCVFENGTLHLNFKFKQHIYRP